MTIENPNLKVAVRSERDRIVREAIEDTPDFLDQKGRIRVKRLTKYDDPNRFDQQFESVVRDIGTTVIAVDAKLVENGKVTHYQNGEAFLKSPTVQRRLQEAKHMGLLCKDETTLAKHALTNRMQGRTLKEGADFEYGLYPDEIRTNGKAFPISDVALPTLNSPAAKNALLVDYLDSHRKSWEAATFNPIAKRISRIIPQFVLGRGVRGSIDSVPHQKAWDDFVKRNKMRPRLKQTLKELIIYGEVFWRFFKTPQGLIVRALDPSTIWDIVTDEEDIENVKYYHQQYVKMLGAVPLPGARPVPSTLVIRQIPAAEVQHYKINSTSSEKRGRSELFPILGYLLRFKEFVNDRILLNKMRAMFALDVAVEGDDRDVEAANDQFATPPGPGAVLVHNKSVEVDFKNTSANAGDAITDAETILKVIAVGAGVSENFLGVARAQTRAGALISTEPDVKNFEDYQELIEEILIDTSDRVFVTAGLAERVMEFTFPSIAQEDRSAKLKDIAFEESMDHISKRRAATMAAREFQISDYDFDKERDAIQRERAGDPVIATGLQQLPKIAPAEPGGEQPGLGGDLKPPENRVTQTSGEMGFKADIGGGRGLANTQATLNRSNFTRGGERTAITNQRTSGTPLRHSADGGTTHGWSQAAREKSLAVRRARAEARRRQEE